MKIKTAAILVALPLFIFDHPAVSQDRIESRRLAAERYVRVMDFEQLMGNLAVAAAQQLPMEKRKKFLAYMSIILEDGDFKDLAIDSLTDVFTDEELNHLANFYESEVGQSITKKMPIYFSLIEPKVEKFLNNAAAKFKDWPE